MRLAIIGHPVAHSLSPLIHETAAKACGIDVSYEAIDVTPDHLHDAVENLVRGRFAGFNVTIPLKVAVMGLVDEADESARNLGALNTVVIDGTKLRGHNTDLAGVNASLAKFKSELRGRSALVFGAGGAGRAVVSALTKDFTMAKVQVFSRSREKALNMIASLPHAGLHCEVSEMDPGRISAALNASSLVVNTTPVGMSPATGGSILPSGCHFRPGQVVFDVVYNPLLTTFLKQAKDEGAQTVGGLEMFVHQGAEAFKLWTGIPMPIDIVRRAVASQLRASTDHAHA